jgi:hypothetical protein
MIPSKRRQRDHKGQVGNPCLGENNQSRVPARQKSKQFPLFTFSDKAARYHKGQIANPCLGRTQPNQSSYAPEKQAVPPLQTTSMNVVTCAGRKGRNSMDKKKQPKQQSQAMSIKEVILLIYIVNSWVKLCPKIREIYMYSDLNTCIDWAGAQCWFE